MKIPLHVTNNASVYRYGQERPAGRLHASRPPNTGLAAFLAAFLIDMEEQHYFGSGLQVCAVAIASFSMRSPPGGGGGHGIVWIEYIHPRYKLSALHRMDACRHGTARHFSLALSCSLAIGQLHTFCNAVTRGRLPRCPCTGRTMAGTPTGRPNSKFGTPDGAPSSPGALIA